MFKNSIPFSIDSLSVLTGYELPVKEDRSKVMEDGFKVTEDELRVAWDGSTVREDESSIAEDKLRAT